MRRDPTRRSAAPTQHSTGALQRPWSPCTTFQTKPHSTRSQCLRPPFSPHVLPCSHAPRQLALCSGDVARRRARGACVFRCCFFACFLSRQHACSRVVRGCCGAPVDAVGLRDPIGGVCRRVECGRPSAGVAAPAIMPPHVRNRARPQCVLSSAACCERGLVHRHAGTPPACAGRAALPASVARVPLVLTSVSLPWAAACVCARKNVVMRNAPGVVGGRGGCDRWRGRWGTSALPLAGGRPHARCCADTASVAIWARAPACWWPRL
jgi:hypothetical protein